MRVPPSSLESLIRYQADYNPSPHHVVCDVSRNPPIPSIEHGHGETYSITQSSPLIQSSKATSNHESHTSKGQSKVGYERDSLKKRNLDNLVKNSEMLGDYSSIGLSEAISSAWSSPALKSYTDTSRYFRTQQSIENDREVSANLWKERFTDYIKGSENLRYGFSSDQKLMPLEDTLGIRPKLNPSNPTTRRASTPIQSLFDVNLVSDSVYSATHHDKGGSPLHSDPVANKHVSYKLSDSNCTAYGGSRSKASAPDFVEYSSIFSQNKQASEAYAQPPRNSSVKDTQDSSDESLDISNLDSKFQQVLSRRLFMQGNRHYKDTKEAVSGHLKQSSSSVSHPKKVATAPRKTTKSFEQSKAPRSKSVYISDASEEDNIIMCKASNVRPKDLKPYSKHSAEVLVSPKNKQAISNAIHNVGQRQKRSRTCAIDLTSDADEDSDGDVFRAKRRYIHDALKPEGSFVIRGTKGREWRLR